MKILLTGGAGFIGSHTADALIATGHDVRVLDILDPQIHGASADFPAYMNPAAQCIKGDVRNAEDVERALDGAEAVYHFAALTGVGQSMYDMRNYVDVNCTGTATLLQALAAKRRPLHRFVLASSRAVYGEGTHRCPVHGIVYPLTRRREDMEQGEFDVRCPACNASVASVPTAEDRPLHPLSIYAWTKQQQEDYCAYAAATFGIPVVILRYFNVYGSRQSLKNPYTGVLSIFHNRMHADRPIVLYEHGTPGRDFVHVSDVVQANLRALDANAEAGARINVGAGIEHTILDVVEMLAQASGRTPTIEDRGEYRIGDVRSCFADLQRSRRVLGYEPQRSLGEGIREFVDWAKQQESIDLYQKTVDELKQHGLFGRGRSSPP